MIFPRAVALAEVAWTGEASMAGQPGASLRGPSCRLSWRPG